METKKYTNVEELTKVADEQFIKYLNENKLTDILKMVGKMPDHTVTNSVLIMHQMPNATFTKRLTDWDKFGRRVKEGQSSIRIISHCLKKYNQEETDEKGNIYAKGVDKLDISLGHVFDISQTVGREYQYLNTNKENIAAHFDAAKQALERTARGYKFSYVDQEENSRIDEENKTIYIKDGLSIDGILNSLVNEVSKVLLDSRREEGLSSNVKENIKELEYNCALYAFKSKYDMDLPNFDFSQVAEYSDDEKLEFRNNLQKVRSVVMQMSSNFETAIEISIRGLNKQQEKEQEEVKEETQQEEPAQKVAPKRKTRAKSKSAESEVE